MIYESRHAGYPSISPIIIWKTQSYVLPLIKVWSIFNQTTYSTRYHTTCKESQSARLEFSVQLEGPIRLTGKHPCLTFVFGEERNRPHDIVRYRSLHKYTPDLLRIV